MGANPMHLRLRLDFSVQNDQRITTIPVGAKVVSGPKAMLGRFCTLDLSIPELETLLAIAQTRRERNIGAGVSVLLDDRETWAD